MKKAKYNLKKNKQIGNDYIADCLKFINKVLIKEKPTHVIVQGDTDTTLCGGLATNIYNRGKSIKQKIKLFHVEAGLRSYDENMPEEINRKVVDCLSEYLFVPTKFELNNLKKENLFKFKKIRVVGNTILESLKILERKIQPNIKKKIIFY